ncbi:MAG: hypothetical protein ACKPH9_26295, partial [Dolichospermum sp.]
YRYCTDAYFSSLQRIMRSFKSSHHQKFEPEKLWCGHIFNQPHPQPPPISKVYPFLPPAAQGVFILQNCYR